MLASPCYCFYKQDICAKCAIVRLLRTHTWWGSAQALLPLPSGLACCKCDPGCVPSSFDLGVLWTHAKKTLECGSSSLQGFALNDARRLDHAQILLDLASFTPTLDASSKQLKPIDPMMVDRLAVI